MKKVCGKLLFGMALCLTLSLGFASMQAEAAPKLNKKNVTLTVGQSVKLKVKGTKKKVKWSSTKKSVCTVKNGTVTAKKKGTATIKAKVAKKTLKCKVTVRAKKAPKPTPTPTPSPTPTPTTVTPTGLTVTGPFTKIAPGGTMQLQLGYVPANAEQAAVKWSTSSSRRATVTSTGLVTAVGTGEVTITAELQSNWRVKGSFTFTVENLAVEGTVGSKDGGDLLLSEAASQAVYSYTVSYTAANVQTQVVDGIGTVIRSYPAGTIGPTTPVTVVWDLKDAYGNPVAPGSYCFQVVAAGTSIRSDFFTVYAKSEFDAGNGSPTSPYEIATLDQLKLVWKHNGVCFKQTENIDAELTELTPMFTADVPFDGVYDGNNHSISNVSNMTDNNNVALFSAIGKKGQVQNLIVENSYFNGKSNIAAIAAINNGTINNCLVRKCSLRASEGRLGAIVAENYGTLRNCQTEENTASAAGDLGGICGYNKGTVIETVSGKDNLALTRGDRSIGGIAGASEGNIIKCTIQSVELSANSTWYTNGGAIAGYNKGTVSECTVEACKIDGTGSKGGIIGWNEGNNTNNNYNGSDYNQTGN